MATLQRESPPIAVLKAVVTGTSIFIAGGMFATSLQFIPSLVAAAERDPSTPYTNRLESGRLTPQPTSQHESKGLSLAVPSVDARLKGSSGSSSGDGSGYKLAAEQFVSMSKTAFVTQVPPELLTILASGFLAYHSYRHRLITPSTLISSAPLLLTWQKWTIVAGLMASIFPLTGGFMVPIDHKIARIAGAEERLEPYEDAPPDRDADRSNTVEFLGKWNTLNTVRSVLVFAAGGISLWALFD